MFKLLRIVYTKLLSRIALATESGIDLYPVHIWEYQGLEKSSRKIFQVPFEMEIHENWLTPVEHPIDRA